MKLVGNLERQADPEAEGVRSLTHAELGERFGVSRARAYQIEQAALRKIRRKIECEAAGAGVSVREWLFGDSG